MSRDLFLVLVGFYLVPITKDGNFVWVMGVMGRCLEEGAEEFLLKPVKLSDMNRLRPHILKGKNKDQQQLQQQQQQQEQHDHEQKQSEQQADNISSSIKRKAVDEGLSPERTRPRFPSNSSLTVL